MLLKITLEYHVEYKMVSVYDNFSYIKELVLSLCAIFICVTHNQIIYRIEPFINEIFLSPQLKGIKKLFPQAEVV